MNTHPSLGASGQPGTDMVKEQRHENVRYNYLYDSCLSFFTFNAPCTCWCFKVSLKIETKLSEYQERICTITEMLLWDTCDWQDKWQ